MRWVVPFFLLQHRVLDRIAQPILPSRYSIVPANIAGEHARVDAHRQAWAPARIKGLLGLTVTGDEPPSGFTLDKYREMTSVSIYRPELDLVVCAPDGSPAAFALGWLDDRSKSVLFEPVGTSPGHARRGLSRAVCSAVMSAARDVGATQSVVGPRGVDAYPAPRRLYESLGFTTLARTTTLTWGAHEHCAQRPHIGPIDRRDVPLVDGSVVGQRPCEEALWVGTRLRRQSWTMP
ncbi:MAG: GNAT family N-acetyltransferase [Nocardioidaceae bacterium]